ncbi:MAG TPA: hypothetical protein PLY93_11940, partial [Turneriella sp.]|nr:hypothetical protein [Turneriella sp.]
MVETFLSSKCPLCAAVGFPHLQKKDAHRKNYKIHRCSQCTVWYIHPMPTSDTLNELYQNTYFKKRSDRGYADYTSEKIYTSVTQTLHKNLTDLNFFAWAKTRPQKRLLEVGCAAGHAVDYFVRRGWEAIGIDI